MPDVPPNPIEAHLPGGLLRVQEDRQVSTENEPQGGAENLLQGGTEEPDPQGGEPTTTTTEQDKKLAGEAAKWRRQARDAEKRATDAEAALQTKNDAEKTELQRAQDAAAAAEQQRDAALATANIRLVNAAVIAAAAKAGAVDPTVVSRLVDSTDITVGDDGTISGATEAVEALLVQHAYLKGAALGTPPDPGTTNPGRPGGVQQLTREQIKTMSAEAIEKARASGQLNEILGITT